MALMRVKRALSRRLYATREHLVGACARTWQRRLTPERSSDYARVGGENGDCSATS